MRKTAALPLAAGALALAACSSSAPAPQLDYSCGVTVVDAQTGISVVLWQPHDSGKAVYVHQVTADYYGATVTVKVDKDVWFNPQANVEVDQALPPSLGDLPLSKGCKVLSWR